VNIDDPTLTDLSSQQQMTHYPGPPNPAQPWLDRAAAFAQGGLSRLFGQQPGTMDYLAHGLSEGAIGAPLGGVMLPVGGAIRPGMTLMGEPTEGQRFMMGTIEPANTNIGRTEIQAQQNYRELQAQLIRKRGLHQDIINRVYEGGKGMSPEQLLQSDRLWAMTDYIAAQAQMPDYEIFSMLANKVFQKMGANKYITPDQAKRYINNYMERGDTTPPWDFSGPTLVK
jgi:hypothetical protein